ncbi:DNA mismatch repair protein MutS [Chromobacterium violaceum]|uniref:Smr/MutS family protein n=1 Tax=Chromobacterium violaceum TaxID=536 RepID=UPI000C127D62|nr:Smr/MutS family protein [Chromobacterium violaceum]ATP29181.1 DNA mismatch repair protein MutS [Chromobacterium violaceum]ATP33091.1 DNA mismatch repair protein MutS [Chromobacterium violaceum]MBX9269723.1 Smr/MutS family protein [Chromobacterium violaceum]QIY81047.1 DNA mismatch repair protein MutS [Chromobacterium violaceum]
MKTFKDTLKGLRQTLRQAAPPRAAAPQHAVPEEADFRQSVGDVKPLKPDGRHHPQPPKPSPRPRKPSQGPALHAAACQEILQHQIGWFEPAHQAQQYARPGMPATTLKRLRQGNWPVCAQLDLHGYTRHQAQDALALFIHRARHRGQCVKVIHGKGFGSPQGEPVLKKLVRSWLQHHPDVLAFCEAETGGGAGSLLVLLRRPPAGEPRDEG